MPDLFGTQFVHTDRRGHDATAGIGNTQTFKQALQAAILTAAPMQRDKHPVRALTHQLLGQLRTGVDAVSVYANGLQCSQHGSTGFEGHRALGRTTAKQHRYPPEYRYVGHQALPSRE